MVPGLIGGVFGLVGSGLQMADSYIGAKPNISTHHANPLTEYYGLMDLFQKNQNMHGAITNAADQMNNKHLISDLVGNWKDEYNDGVNDQSLRREKNYLKNGYALSPDDKASSILSQRFSDNAQSSRDINQWNAGDTQRQRNIMDDRAALNRQLLATKRMESLQEAPMNWVLNNAVSWQGPKDTGGLIGGILGGPAGAIIGGNRKSINTATHGLGGGLGGAFIGSLYGGGGFGEIAGGVLGSMK